MSTAARIPAPGELSIETSPFNELILEKIFEMPIPF